MAHPEANPSSRAGVLGSGEPAAVSTLTAQSVQASVGRGSADDRRGLPMVSQVMGAAAGTSGWRAAHAMVEATTVASGPRSCSRAAAPAAAQA